MHRLSWKFDTVNKPIVQVKKWRFREEVHSFRVTQLIEAGEQDLNSYPLGSSVQACVVLLASLVSSL